MISRTQALNFLNEQIANKNIIKHMLATEAIMRALAKQLEPEKEEVWAIAGLLHDGDYTDKTPINQQGIKVSHLLKEKNYEIPQEVEHAMAAHNWHATGVEPNSKMAWALYICDSLTGLIIATVLVHPDRKLSSINIASVMKKFKDKAFASGTRREDILLCEERLTIPLEQFASIGLEAMQAIAGELGL